MRAPYLLFMVMVVLVGSARPERGQSASPIPADAAGQQSVTQTLSEPAGANRCIVCHRSEVEGYARSAMAHSLRRAGNEPDGVVKTTDATITMHSAPTGYWQSLQSGGETSTYHIDYVIGSGNHAAGYLLDMDGHLFQSPVAYYKSRHGYDLAPGYEGRPDPDFTRPVVEGCVFCHSGSELHIAGTTNLYRSPPFSAEAITCERCHGSAERHLRDPRAGTIVNPAKLEPAARDSVCEQCHLLGVARVLNPGKTYRDYTPGEPLENVFTTYVNALPPGQAAGKFKVISHVEQFARSTCARKSDGRMWCGTCHDPHDKPMDPVAYYRSKCLTCHTGKFAEAAHPSKVSNCIGCHMPRRNAKDGGHTAFTDHRIQRRPEPQPDLPDNTDIAAWRKPAPELQKRNLGIAYVNVGTDRRSAQFIGQGYRMLAEVQDQFPNDSEVFMSIGNALLLAKQSSEAEFAFQRVLQLDPRSVIGQTKAASVSMQEGDIAAATTRLERAVALDPLHLPAVSTLLDLYKQQGDNTKAGELSAKVAALMNHPAVDQSSQPHIGQPHPGDVATTSKNVQVLKNMSPDELLSSMRFISASLGVGCNYCHEENHFDSDAKKTKQIARDMMRMTMSIDKNGFQGMREITCYSCHRGSSRPQSAPTIASEMQSESAPDVDHLTANLPTASQIIENYIRALGGAEAIERITSREVRGTRIRDGKSSSIEIFERNPDMLEWVRHIPAGDRIAVLNGREGWSQEPGQPAQNMEGVRLDAMEMAADLHFPLHIEQLFDELQVEYPERIDGRDAYVILGKRHGNEPVKFYFDRNSGLLVRVLRYSESPLGVTPLQIDYSDYRSADGIQVPFCRVVARPDETVTIQWQQVQQNISIDAARFSRPAALATRRKSPT
jgi:hypothetical protein